MKRIGDFIFLLFLVIILSSNFSFTQNQKSYYISDIYVEGNVFSDPQTIISLTGLNRGETITLPYDNKLQKAIKNLWNRKQFEDVQILVDKIIDNYIFLVIKVKELPRISEIIIKNNKKVSKEDLLKIINKNRGEIISKYEVYQITQKIKKKYQEEGLPFANVDAQLTPSDTQNFLRLVIDIDEGFKYTVKSIDFVGNNYFSDKDLMGAFEETKTKSWWQFWRSAKFEPNNYQKDKELLLSYCRNNGFIDFEILGDTIIYDDKEKEVHIKIFVNEGKKYYFRNIYFLGNSVFPSEILLRRLEISKGEPYNQEKLQQNLNGNKENTDAMSLYFDNGYLFARSEIQEIRIEPDSLDLYIRIYEGNRVTIRKVDIVGNTKTKDKVIRRELYTYPGDYFNRSAIIKSVKALGLLNYFNPETLRPDVKMVDNTKVDIVYHVEERSTDTFNASIGFAGSFGLTGAIGFSFNNFSILEPLKGGGGQLFNFNLEFGQANRYRTISIGFTEPWLFDDPTTLGFNLYDTRIIYNPIDLRRTGFGINVGRRLRWPDDYFRIDGGFRVQRNNVGSGYSNYYRPGVSTEFTLFESISRISLDNIFFPTSGSRFSWSNDIALGSFGIGTTDFFKTQLRFEINQTVLKIKELPRVVLNVSSNWGYITGLKSDTSINPIELFFMGGTGLSSGFPVTPLRGYPDQSIGPRGGGKVLARHFAELRFAVSLDPMPIYFYGFVEAGNVWSELSRTDPFNLKRSAGVGVQIFLQALGIIGFSYGYGFDKTDDTGQLSGWRFLFHIGQ
ncbi:MAG: outer membrane protein assembly factor BamA [Ignavibacteria bacterium]|nr:outer membrane protein assembly factor BamA [Ignavibacteria bacterium]